MRLRLLASTLVAACASLPCLAEEVVNLYSWPDYFPPAVIASFEHDTGIRVVYSTFDSNAVLEAKLSAGSSGYDVVVPNAVPHLGRQILAGFYLELDRARLPNVRNLDPDILRVLSDGPDPGNRFAVPWMWGTTGISYNVDRIRQIMPDAPVDSLAMLFDPAIVSRFKECGVNLLDSADDVFPAALMYLGRDGSDLAGDAVPAAAELVKRVRPFIRTLDSSNYITELASGSLCLTLGYSGDAKIAADRARDAGNGVRIGYAIPTQGASVYIDSLAIPKDAPHPDAAYAFIDYMLRPAMAAQATNATGFPNANAAATPLVDEAVRNDPGLYPGPEVRRRLVLGHPQSPATVRLVSRSWTQIKSGL